MLTGFARSYNERWQAEADTKRVKGVAAVANDIEVRLPALSQRPDPDIARDIVTTLRNELPYSAEEVKAAVKDGWVTLDGEVEWNYQRVRAEAAVRRVRGVKHVTNSVTLKPARAVPAQVKQKIEEALTRSATVDAIRIISKRTVIRLYCVEPCDPGLKARKPSGRLGRHRAFVMLRIGLSLVCDFVGGAGVHSHVILST
jgi:hypothetical protein